MPRYVYVARNQEGGRSTGTVDAESQSRAVAVLREQGLWVTDLRPSGKAESTSQAGGAFRRRAASPKDLSLFYRQMYTMVNSGMSLFQALELLSQPGQTTNHVLRQAIGVLGSRVVNGGRLSDAMARFPHLFDRMQIRMIDAGETGGTLPDIFRRLSEYLEREYELRMQISQKTLYPKLVMLLLLLVAPISTPLTVPSYLAGLRDTITTLLLLIVPLWLGVRLLLASRPGRELYDQVKVSVPVFGPLVKKMAVARFARTLASLYGAGVPIATALAMSGEASGNSVLEHRTMRLGPALERGVSMAQALQSSGFFPAMFLGMVSTGESTGNLDAMLDKAADFYEEESAHTVQQMVVVLGVALLIISGIIVAFKVLSFYTGYVGGIMSGIETQFNEVGTGE